jgi:hypothetical protein
VYWCAKPCWLTAELPLWPGLIPASLVVAGLFALGADAACTGKLTDLQSTAGTDGFSLFYQVGSTTSFCTVHP